VSQRDQSDQRTAANLRVTLRVAPTTLAGLMDREVLDKWCERGILALVLAILVFGPLATGAVRTLEFLIIQGLTLGVMLLWTVRLWASARPQFLWPPICWAVLAFTVYALARYLTADIEYVARQELIRILVYAFLFFAILNNLHRQESMQFISFTMVFLAMGISFYALYQFLTGSDKVWHFVSPYKHRGSGTYINPNHLGGFLEILLPLGLAYTMISRAKPVMKVFLGYASLAIIAGIAVTVSRGSWFSAGATLLVFFVVLAMRRTYRLPILLLLTVLIGAGVYFIPRTHMFQARLKQVFAQGEFDDDMRFSLWRPAIQLWKENIWWGIGPAHYNYRFPEYRPEGVQLQPDRAHNDYLNALVDWGIVGVGLVASAWLLLCAGVFKTWKFVRGTPNDLGRQSSNKFAFVLGASLGLFAILVHSAVDFNLHTPANAILVVSLMALLSAHLRFATERYWQSARLWTQVSTTVVLAVGLVYLGYQAWRRGVEYAWLERAAHAPDYSPKRIAALEKAFAAEPRNFKTVCDIGEAFRVQSSGGGKNHQQLAGQAMQWFERCTRLNRFDHHGFVGYGLCLDWLERPDEAWPYFDKAAQLDPNGYFTVAYIGVYYFHRKNYAAARAWFERSQRLEWKDNPMANNYLTLINERMLEAATNNAPLGLKLPVQ
jgi:O-antigen ligase